MFNNYSTDIALRYFSVIDIIRKDKLDVGKMLEVGSGDLGITPYLKKKVVGLDIEFTDNSYELLKKVKFNGKDFPFKDNEFCITISVDNIEHIPKDRRKDFIREMLRVTDNTLILVVPYGQLSYRHDAKLSDYFYRVNKKTDKFLNEHINNGLPEMDDLILMLKTSSESLNRNIKIIENKKILNLKLRYFIMKCKISKNKFLNILYYIFLFFLPLRNLFNFGNCYRRIIYLKIT